MSEYFPAKFMGDAFHCPICNVYAAQTWDSAIAHGVYVHSIQLCKCSKCLNNSIWVNKMLAFPLTSSAPIANDDMPEHIKKTYNEARQVVNLSTKSAIFLLRYALEELLIYCGANKDNINLMIGQLVKEGKLTDKMQKISDSIRVKGAGAGHPNDVDSNDPDNANKLFKFMNILCERLITEPKEVEEFFDKEVPDSKKKQIEERDKKVG